jgi:cytochrome c peroxidase
VALPASASDANPPRDQARSIFGVIEPVHAKEVNDPMVQLGRALFWDTRLSADGEAALRKLSPGRRLGG